MNLLDTASLVVTPNGYKASKLYSIVPSDGTGDMTFARTGDTATRVNSNGLIETVLANKPRLDYTSSTCPKLLLEPQRTNLVRYSQDIDNNAWGVSTSNATVTKTANYAISPDGSTNADRLQMNLTGAGYADILQSIVINNGTTYTYSVYLKANTGTPTLKFLSDGSSNINITLNSSWVRYTYTFVGATGFAYPRFLIQADTSSSADILVYGAQLEAGAYATSYIPTTTASVTRNEDVCSKTSATALIGQTEGTMFWDGIISNAGSNVILNLTLNGTNDRYLEITTGLQIRYIEYSTTTQANIATVGNYVTLGNRYKIAAAYKANDFVLYVNGVQIGTDTSGTVFAADKVYNGYYTSGFQGLIKNNSIALWKTRLTNQELVTLTTI